MPLGLGTRYLCLLVGQDVDYLVLMGWYLSLLKSLAIHNLTPLRSMHDT